MTTVGFGTIIPFVGLFVLFMVLGFYGKYWRRGNLNDTHERSLAGRKLGTALFFNWCRYLYCFCLCCNSIRSVCKRLALLFCYSVWGTNIWNSSCYHAAAFGFIKRKRIHHCF